MRVVRNRHVEKRVEAVWSDTGHRVEVTRDHPVLELLGQVQQCVGEGVAFALG